MSLKRGCSVWNCCIIAFDNANRILAETVDETLCTDLWILVFLILKIRTFYVCGSVLGEVLKLLEQEGVSLSDVAPAPLDTM